MKDLLKASIPVIIGAFMGLGIVKLLDIYFSFIYNHFGETGTYVSTFIGSIVLGTIINYAIHKHVSDNAEGETKNDE